MDIPHLIGPCCYKKKIGDLLLSAGGAYLTHQFWSEGDLTLELLLPYLTDRLDANRRCDITLCLPTLARPTLSALSQMIRSRKVKDIHGETPQLANVTILTRHLTDTTQELCAMLGEENTPTLDYHGTRIRIGSANHLTAQLVVWHQHSALGSAERSILLSGSLPQQCAQSDSLLTLSTNLEQYRRVMPYLEYLTQIAFR